MTGTDNNMSGATVWRDTIKGRPTVGGIAERARQTSMQDVISFSNMTGDRNPLHYDEELAAGTPFGGLIVQGGVTTGLLNATVRYRRDVQFYLGCKERSHFVQEPREGQLVFQDQVIAARQ
jgi:hypothetical protein